MLALIQGIGNGIKEVITQSSRDIKLKCRHLLHIQIALQLISSLGGRLSGIWKYPQSENLYIGSCPQPYSYRNQFGLPSCPLIRYVATTCHYLFFCPKSRFYWKREQFWQLLCNSKEQSFLDILLCISNKVFVEELRLFCVITWGMWGEICKRKHDSALLEQPIDVNWVQVLVSEYRLACQISLPQSRDIDTDQNSTWMKPQIWQLRLDVDAGFNYAKGGFLVGAIIQDEHESIKATMATKVRHQRSVIGGELNAILLGMKFCMQNNLSNIWICSDSLEAINVINHAIEYFGHECSLITQIQNIIAANGFLGLQHLWRNANNDAHSLAKFAMSRTSSVWLDIGFSSWLQIFFSDLHD